MRPIKEIAKKAGLCLENLIHYGNYIAKVDYQKEKIRFNKNPCGKLIVVTSITPTKAGEGKTCTAIGLTQALGRLKKSVSLCLREPSLGPIFGIKGGATGSGKSQVYPAEDINLHFTGDIHAVTATHNLLASLLDNHIVKGNKLNINPKQIIWKRALDINDRELRYVILGLKKKSRALKRSTGFIITAASEIMAILGLVEDLNELRTRLGEMTIAYDFNGRPVKCKELNIVGSLMVLLKNVINPNLVQTGEGQPVFIHTGPFANIAHGNNSIIATNLAMMRTDYVITESGFGSDLGMEKFFDIVLSGRDIKPSAVVLIASIRALNMHGSNKNLHRNIESLERGLVNLEAHIKIVSSFGIVPVVAINKFPDDTKEEIEIVKNYCEHRNVPVAVSEVVSRGSEGGIELAEHVLNNIKSSSDFKPFYKKEENVKNKIFEIATGLYGASGVKYSKEAQRDIEFLNTYELENLPVNIAKTHLSLSHNSKLKGAPEKWKLFVKRIMPATGAGFLVVFTGDIRLMPGLPEHPAAENIDLTDKGTIKGLF